MKTKYGKLVFHYQLGNMSACKLKAGLFTLDVNKVTCGSCMRRPVYQDDKIRKDKADASNK